MRNLKRALSMALASVMVLGLTVIGAGAASYEDFTDKDEIVHKDAVSMVTELGVLAGLPDGSFGGSQNIDRASFARLVCVVLNGGKEPVLGNLTTTFTDTQGNWAEKYISFCVDRGIIAGRGNNTFGPSDNVTGSEAAKMLLVALGYNTAYEGIGGATWEVTTNSLANMAGLYEGLETINPSEPLSRDNAAQMIYNVLNADVVSYSFSFNADGSTTAVQNKSEKTMLEDKFGVVIVEGIALANEFADIENGGDALKAGKTTIKVTNYNDGQNNYGNKESTRNETFNVSSGKDVLGRSVVLYVKPSATASTSADKGTVVGSVLVSSTNTVVENSGRDNLYTVADDNKLSLVDDKTLISQNYGKAAANNALLQKGAADATRGEIRTLIDNDNDTKVDYVLFETYALGKVTKYSTADDGSITINGTSSLAYDDKADVVGFDDVAKNDYVLYAQIGGKLYVQKAESVTGELTAYKADGAKSTLTVDGTKYDASGLSFYSDGNKLVSAQGYNNLDKDATFYLDTKGNIIAVDGTAASSNYAFLISAATVGGVDKTTEVKVALDDGTTGVYTLDEDNSDVSASDKKILCTYTVSDDEIALKKVTGVSAEQNNAAIEVKKGNATVKGITGAYADANTVFFYVAPKGTYNAGSNTIATHLDVDSVESYVGKDNVAGIDTTTDFIYYTKDGDIKAVVIVTDSVGTSSNYIYLYQKMGRNSDGFLYNAIVDGEIKTDVVVTTNADLGLYPYSTTTKGFYKVGTAIDTKGNVARLDGNSVIVGGTEYKLTDSTVIANIDGGDTALDAVINEGDYIVFKANSDKELEAVFVTLPYDASKTEITVNTEAATTANVTVEISGDVITISGTDKASTTGTELKGILKTADSKAVVKVAENANGSSEITSSNVVSGNYVVVTYTDNGNTLVDVYTIKVAD